MDHVTTDTLARFRELSEAEVLEASRHLRECSACAALAQEQGGEDALLEVRFAFGLGMVEHPESDPDLFDYVAGTLDAEQRESIAVHLRWCAECRITVDDLRTHFFARAAPNPSPLPGRERGLIRRVAVAAAFAGIAFLLAAIALMQRPRSPQSSAPVTSVPVTSVNIPAPPPAVDPVPRAWRDTVQAALERGRIDPPPMLSELRGPREILRSTTPAPQRSEIEPAGVIVESQTPRFRWPPIAGAQYVATISSEATVVARSPVLETAEWTPPTALSSGKIYAWQVEVRRGPEITIVPQPPEPMATFAVLDDAKRRELDAARRLAPDDHLLLGVLYARAGLQRQAADELARGNASARALAAGVRKW